MVNNGTSLSGTHINKRLPEIMMAGTVFCLFVIIIHSASLIVSAGAEASAFFIPAAVMWRMCSCAAQGFVFLAGLRFMLRHANEEKLHVPKYIFCRIGRILPLYLAWCAIYYGYSLLTSEKSFDVKEFFIKTALGDLAPHLYFVPLILQFAFIAPISLLLRKKLPASFILPASVLITSIFGDFLPDIIGVLFPDTAYFEYSDRVFTSFLIYWSAGCCAGAAYDSFCSALDKAKGIITAAFLFTAALDLGAVYYSFVLGRFVWCMKQIQTLYVLTAIMFILALSRIFTGRCTTPPIFLQKTELAEYSVYLSHILPIWLAQLAIDNWDIDITLGFFIRLTCAVLWFLAVSHIYGQRLYRLHANTK